MSSKLVRATVPMCPECEGEMNEGGGTMWEWWCPVCHAGYDECDWGYHAVDIAGVEAAVELEMIRQAIWQVVSGGEKRPLHFLSDFMDEFYPDGWRPVGPDADDAPLYTRQGAPDIAGVVQEIADEVMCQKERGSKLASISLGTLRRASISLGTLRSWIVRLEGSHE